MSEAPKEGYVIPTVVSSVALREGPANLIEKRKPKEAALALEMMAFGATYEEVHDQTGLAIDTISRLRARHEMALDERRQQLATDALEIAEGLRHLQIAKIKQLANDPEQLAKTNLRDLSIPWAVANDKYFNALGENKTIIEHRTGAPSIEDARQAIAAARAKLKAGSIETVVTPTQ